LGGDQVASISIGDSIGEGFALIRRQPVTVLVWGALQTAVSLVLTMVMNPTYTGMMQSVQSMSAAGNSSAAAMANLAPMLQAEGVLMLIGTVGFFFSLIFYCAVFRAVLRPNEKSFAYLRVGMTEVLLFAFVIGASIGLGFGVVIAFIPVFLLVAIAAAAHAPVISGLFIVVAYIGILVALVWAGLRLSLVGPMMISDGRFHFRDAWKLTRGHAGALFAIGLCLTVVLLVVMAVNVALTLSMGGPQAQSLMQAFQAPHPGAPPAQLIPPLTPMVVVKYLIAIPVSGCIIAIWGAPWARAYRDLAQPDVAATFA